MNKNLVNLTPEEILNKEFKIDTRGYRLKEVDQFLDEIILNLKQEIRDLKTTVEISRSAINKDELSGSNLDILRRLSKLEKAVYGKDE